MGKMLLSDEVKNIFSQICSANSHTTDTSAPIHHTVKSWQYHAVESLEKNVKAKHWRILKLGKKKDFQQDGGKNLVKKSQSRVFKEMSNNHR